MIVLNEGQTYQEVFFKYLSKKVSFPPSPPPSPSTSFLLSLLVNRPLSHSKYIATELVERSTQNVG